MVGVALCAGSSCPWLAVLITGMPSSAGFSLYQSG